MLDLGLGARDAADFLTELTDRHFARVADIHGFVKITHHEAEYAVDEIGHKAKAARLRAVTNNSEWLVRKFLRQKYAKNRTVGA